MLIWGVDADLSPDADPSLSYLLYLHKCIYKTLIGWFWCRENETHTKNFMTTWPDHTFEYGHHTLVP